MELDAALVEMAKYSASGALIVVLIMWIKNLQDRLLAVVEKNTEAFGAVKSALDILQKMHESRRGGLS